MTAPLCESCRKTPAAVRRDGETPLCWRCFLANANPADPNPEQTNVPPGTEPHSPINPFGKLHSDQDWRRLLTSLYYRELSADPDVVASLRHLFDRLDHSSEALTEVASQLGQPTPEVSSWWRATEEEVREWEAKAAADGPAGAVAEHARLWARYYRLCFEGQQALREFCARWPLPAEGPQDALHSYRMRRWIGDRLIVGSRGQWLPSPGLPIAFRQLRSDTPGGEEEEVVVVERQPWIFPLLPLPFLYDPLQGRQWLDKRIDEICKAVRTSIMVQARKYEQHVKDRGYSQTRPYSTDLREVQHRVHRLYLRNYLT